MDLMLWNVALTGVLALVSWFAKTMSPEWATYRQALRDITGQEGFPYSVIWPTKPE